MLVFAKSPILRSLVVACCCTVMHARADEKPNVLFIAIDDLNDWVGCMGGHPNAKTPHIDRLAQRGVLFTNAHCQAPICGPSRASLFTGLLPSTTGIYGQIRDKHIARASEAAGQAVLLPDYFERHGYKTMAAGKMFHNGDAAQVFQKYGVPMSFGPKPPKRMRYDPQWFRDKIGSTQTDWGAFPERDESMPDYRIAAFAIEQLKTKHEKPFFLGVGFCRPHVPWHVPQAWFDMHPVASLKTPPYKTDDLDDVPELSRRVNEIPAMPTTDWAIRKKEWKNIVQAYLASTTFVDAQVGKVLDALDASEHADNTIVILWSDHGYHLGEKNRFAKQALWDRANRVPLVIVAPKIEGGRACSAAVGLIDIYPSLVELCGLPPQRMNEGHSLVPLLRKTDAPWGHATITTYGRGNHAVQSEHYRYYRYEDGSAELYDHRLDPNEWHNRADDASLKPVIDEMKRKLPRINASAARFINYPTNEYFKAKARQDKAERQKSTDQKNKGYE